MNICILLSLFFCTSCSNESIKAFDYLSQAFNDWYSINHQISNNSRFPLDNSVIKKIGDSGYINEYLEDLKRFKLELNQINKSNLYKMDRYKYMLINNVINTSIFNTEKIKRYLWDPSYYSNSLYHHTLYVILNKDISTNNKIEILFEIIDYLPKLDYDFTFMIL